MAFAIADPSQEYWLDPSFRIAKHGTVAYFQVDTPRPAWHARLDLINARHNYQIPANTLHFSDSSSSPYPFDILNLLNFAWLKNEIARISPNVVFIDTLREVHGSDEDSSTAMRNIVARLVAACQPAAIVLISHSRKGNRDRQGNGGDDIMDAARGSSYVAGRMDMVARLTQHHLYTKGRAAMDAKFPVRQELGTGLLVADYAEGEMEMLEVVKGVVLVKPKHESDRMRLLSVMYPDASQDSLRRKMNSAKANPAMPDPKKTKYTMADIERMTARVGDGVHPTLDIPMPKVNLSNKGRKKPPVDEGEEEE
jgi:hypothetical protein